MKIDFTFKINADVVISAVDIGARVTAATWDGSEEMYSIVYWLDGTRNVDLVYVWELEEDES
jgi:hypothetical protein